ncbi:MAG TPA: hypothetical protein RMG48_17850 [Myxococcales bacterium LLY-WYZ-16_1]|nr:hypothetical protein [Myxococcales bacterium LLY-WYZ-16_1]
MEWYIRAVRGLLHLLTLPCVAALTPGVASAEPWYDRPSCQAATQVTMGVDFDEVDAVLSKLERSRDLDDKACAVYNRALESEMRITIYGETPQTLAFREKHLKRMFGFAKAHAKYGARFRDLEIEARMRRVRVLFDGGQKTAAMGEARRTSKLLEAHGDSSTPTVDFVKGTMFSALGEANLLARTALWAAGVSGSADEGTRSLQKLLSSDTVYRHEATYVALHFAKEKAKDGANSPFGNPTMLARRLAKSFPSNPQFAYEYAQLLQGQESCDQALEITQPFVARLESNSGAWTPSIRAKVYLVSASCNLSTGDLAKAGRYRNLLAKQDFDDLQGELTALSRKLERAQSQVAASSERSGG